LHTLVDSYRKTFIDDPYDPLEAGNADGKKLYATLIQPAEKLNILANRSGWTCWARMRHRRLFW
jgi:hypothetical protein